MEVKEENNSDRTVKKERRSESPLSMDQNSLDDTLLMEMTPPFTTTDESDTSSESSDGLTDDGLEQWKGGNGNWTQWNESWLVADQMNVTMLEDDRQERPSSLGAPVSTTAKGRLATAWPTFYFLIFLN
jgi:hypothetical protein